MQETTEDFITKARKVHGNKYDYSKVNYVNTNTKICIVDKTYGDFWMLLNNHLKGQGHPEWRRIKHKKPIYGVGINDVGHNVHAGSSLERCYKVWRGMFERCYSERWKRLYPSYANCSVCEDWKLFSRFIEWYNRNYVEGYEIDKDLFSKDSKIYSPQTCVFLPPEINKMLLDNTRKDGRKVGAYKSSKNRFVAAINLNKKRVHVGCFKTEDEAHQAYLKERRKYVQHKAEEYLSKGKISKRVYDALLNFVNYE